MTPTESDVAALLHSGGRLRGEFRWRKVGKTNYRAECPIEEMYEGAKVKLVGTYNHKTGNLSYTLVWSACRVRSLDFSGLPHRNPDGVVHDTPHKHRWSDDDRDRWVYRPTDITAADLRGVFEQFLGECNIQFDGIYFDAIHQEDLGL